MRNSGAWCVVRGAWCVVRGAWWGGEAAGAGMLKVADADFADGYGHRQYGHADKHPTLPERIFPA
jgi:hypothetical protein